MFDNVIVIPYRNRERHLKYYLENTVPLLKQYLPNSKVVIIEQGQGGLFNRGKVLNVGFKEYRNKTKYFITNDVDINPKLKTIQEYFLPEVPEQAVSAIYSSDCGTLGGIIKISAENIFKINGFPNNIWGWGHEDKALQNRAALCKLKKIKGISACAGNRDNEFIRQFDDTNDRIPSIDATKYYNAHYLRWNGFSIREKIHFVGLSGLNNIKYSIKERTQIDDYVEMINVDIV
jgi:hypothetical protein